MRVLETRHNAGFWFNDAWPASWASHSARKRALHGLAANARSDGVWLLMLNLNRSASPVAALARFYWRINPAEILVVHDELDIRRASCATSEVRRRTRWLTSRTSRRPSGLGFLAPAGCQPSGRPQRSGQLRPQARPARESELIDRSLNALLAWPGWPGRLEHTDPAPQHRPAAFKPPVRRKSLIIVPA